MIQIRRAVCGDASQIITFVNLLINEPNSNLLMSPGEFNYSEEQEQELIRQCNGSGNSLYLVAEADNRIIGILHCAGGSRKATRHEATLSMSVDCAYRNQGVGAKLLTEAITWARQNPEIRRLDLVVFERNQAAFHLYDKFGFEIEGHHHKTVFRDGEYLDTLTMALLC